MFKHAVQRIVRLLQICFYPTPLPRRELRDTGRDWLNQIEDRRRVEKSLGLFTPITRKPPRT